MACKRICIGLIFFLLFVCVIFPVTAREPETKQNDISIFLSPAFPYAPATIQLKVIIVPDSRNQRVCVSLMSRDYDKYLCWDTAGIDEPKVRLIPFYYVPAGHYEARAHLKRKGVEFVDVTPVNVDVLSGDEPTISPRR